MNSAGNKQFNYKLIRASRTGKSMFVNIAATEGLQAFRAQHRNQDLHISACSYDAPDPSAERIHPLYFCIASENAEEARISTLQACYCIVENFNVPEDCIEIVYNGGADTRNRDGNARNSAGNADHLTNTAIHDNDFTGKNTAHGCKTSQNTSNGPAIGDHNAGSGADSTGNNGVGSRTARNPVARAPRITGEDPRTNKNRGENQQPGTRVGTDSRKTAMDGIPGAEMIIVVPPVVFGSPVTPLMPVINFELARQLTRDRIKHLDIDVYQRDYFVPLPNSINSTTGRFAIPLSMKELLYLDATAIAELAQNPRSEDSMIIPRRIPEAAEWFDEVRRKAEEEHQKQGRLQQMLLENGWQIPPCIRRLVRADLGKNAVFEACRIICGYYAWIKAGKDEIWYQISSLRRRHAIKNYQKLRVIAPFGIENPKFAGCEHPLLKRFCHRRGCFMVELIKEYERPYLFEQTQ